MPLLARRWRKAGVLTGERLLTALCHTGAITTAATGQALSGRGHHMSPCPSLQPSLASAGVVGAGLVWGKPLPQDGIEDRVYR